jgi:hypothetical protein
MGCATVLIWSWDGILESVRRASQNGSTNSVFSVFGLCTKSVDRAVDKLIIKLCTILWIRMNSQVMTNHPQLFLVMHNNLRLLSRASILNPRAGNKNASCNSVWTGVKSHLNFEKMVGTAYFSSVVQGTPKHCIHSISRLV